jgi:hypothetical protein
MNPNFNPRSDYNLVKMTLIGTSRDDIDTLLDMLHEEQLGMIDRAVDSSDLRDARELIEYIKGL